MDFEHFILIVVMMLSYTLGFFSGSNTGKEIIRKEAVREDCAFYSADKNGTATFTWGNKR